MGLDYASSVPDLHGGSDPSVETDAGPRIAGSGSDPLRGAVEELSRGRAEGPQRDREIAFNCEIIDFYRANLLQMQCKPPL